MRTADGTCGGPRRAGTPGASRAERDGSLSKAPWTEKDRREPAEEPVAGRQVRRPLASTAPDDQLLLEEKVLRHHRSYTTGAAQLCGHDGEVNQGEQEVAHLRVSVG